MENTMIVLGQFCWQISRDLTLEIYIKYIYKIYRIESKRHKKVRILTEQLTVPSLTLVFPDCLHCLNTGQNNLDIIATKTLPDRHTQQDDIQYIYHRIEQ